MGCLEGLHLLDDGAESRICWNTEEEVRQGEMPMTNMIKNLPPKHIWHKEKVSNLCLCSRLSRANFIIVD